MPSYLKKEKTPPPPEQRRKKAKELLAVVDGAIEHGATDEALERERAARNRSKSPIPKGSTTSTGSGPKPAGGGWNNQIALQSKRKKEEAEAKKRKKEEKEAALKKKLQDEEEAAAAEKKKKAAAKKKKQAAAAAAKAEAAKQERVDALEQAKQQKLAMQERLKKQQEQEAAKRQQQKKEKGDDDDDAVKRIPKKSALLAMGGPDVEEYKKQIERAKKAKWEAASSGEGDANPRWYILEQSFDGQSSSDSKKEQHITDESISLQEGIEMFKTNPQTYVAMYFMPNHPNGHFTFVLRAGTTGYQPVNVRDDSTGRYTIIRHMYKRLEPFPYNILPKEFRDSYTDTMTFQGKKLHSIKTETKKPILPGRGMNMCDSANMTLIGHNDDDDDDDGASPNDIWQGSVGNCWLLSAIACLADFDFAIQRLFRKTSNPKFSERPIDSIEQPNLYTVSLWDLKTWKEVDIVIDERLPVKSDGSGLLLGAKPSKEEKLWVCYLEKALAIHCGGYDKLEGGNCTDAWPMLTGSRNQFIIQKSPSSKDKYVCSAKFNPYDGTWMEHANSPQDYKQQALWRVDWPKVGGTGGKGTADMELSQKELFDRIVTWDEHNFLIGAGTDGVSDKNKTDGLVDNHAYSIIDSRQDICNTGIDLLLIRNPWGEGGELEHGQFKRFGPGWKKYPNIKKELNPSTDDNGLQWVTKEEFFQYFPTIYVCGMDISKLQDENYVNDLKDNFDHSGMKQPVPTKKKAKPQPAVQVEEEEFGPIYVNKKSDPNSPYKIVEQSFNGSVTYDKINKKVIQGTSIPAGVDEFRNNPEKYLAIHYQTSIVEQGWPAEVHQFTYIYRDGTTGFQVEGASDGAKRTILTNVLR